MTAGLVVELAASLELAPALISRRGEMRDSKRRSERQHLACAVGESLVNLGDESGAIAGDPFGCNDVLACPAILVPAPELASDRGEPSRFPGRLIRWHPEPNGWTGILGWTVRQATMNPTSDRRLRNLEIREEVSIPQLENRLLESVIVGPP
jgi:hypothetical protein